jgi:hypothetical protein
MKTLKTKNGIKVCFEVTNDELAAILERQAKRSTNYYQVTQQVIARIVRDKAAIFFNTVKDYIRESRKRKQ